MNITRKRFIVMRNNRSEVWCGLSKHFYFKPISEVKDTSVKTYRSQAQAEAGCSSWDRNFEVVPVTESIVIDSMTNADRIRAMSDEELAEFLASVENRRSASGGGAQWCGMAHALKWLQQPAEDDDHSICGATNLPCIRCNPGGCDNRKEGAD